MAGSKCPDQACWTSVPVPRTPRHHGDGAGTNRSVEGIGAEDQQKCDREFIHRCFRSLFYFIVGDALERHSNGLPAICKGGFFRKGPVRPLRPCSRGNSRRRARSDQLRLGRIGFDLAAQPQDLHVDRAVVDVVVQPARFQQLVAAQDLLRRLEERREQANSPLVSSSSLPRGSNQLARPACAARSRRIGTAAVPASRRLPGLPCARRSTARMRASSSRGLKGLVT